MGRAKAILVELVNPSLDNPPLWYKWGSNQISHFALGIVTAWVLTTAVFLIDGEYPYKEALWGFIFMGYLAKELLLDKVSGWDTLNDTMFFAVYGAGGAIFAFSESEVGKWEPVVNPYSLTAVLVVFFLHLIAGVLSKVDVDD